MTYLPPCKISDSPDDWFISRDGKQYGDEEFLTPEERDSAALSVLYRQGETVEEHQERMEAAIRAAENGRRREALGRRRRAKEACFQMCRMRLDCLEGALDRVETHGTWGGYYEEELHQIRRVAGPSVRAGQ